MSGANLAYPDAYTSTVAIADARKLLRYSAPELTDRQCDDHMARLLDDQVSEGFLTDWCWSDDGNLMMYQDAATVDRNRIPPS